jgi:60 kDa SS-A/Ro ribonucleoprotein
VRRLRRWPESVTKYQQRNGWAHLDALRLCHAEPASKPHAAVFAYIAKGIDAANATAAKPFSEPKGMAVTKRVKPDPTDCAAVLAFFVGVEEAKRLEQTDGGETRCVELIHEHRLVREHVPSSLLGSVAVWRALLEQMPLTALMRSLAKLTNIGLASPGSEAAARLWRG